MSTSHVYLTELGPELSHEDLQFMTYDDTTQQLLVVKGGHVFAYDVASGPAGHSSLKWMYPLQDGPPVIAMRPSLDNRMLALQRAPALLELVDLASGLCFVHSTHQGRGEILEFFFTDAPDCDLVVVTTQAVEINQFVTRRQGLRCRERIRLQAAWARYTHETRMVLVGASAAPRSGLSAWQFASHGVTHVPLFELQGILPATAAVRQFLPPTPSSSARQPSSAASTQAVATAASTAAVPAGAPSDAGSLPAAASEASSATGHTLSPIAARASGTPHKHLNPDALWLLKMYGRVYLAHVDAAAHRLELYRFYTDTIILEHVLDLFFTEVQLSVADNTLIVHHPPTAVAVLFDVALPQHKPLANPLPLRRLQLLPEDLIPAARAELQQQQRQQQDTTSADAGGGSSSSTDSTAQLDSSCLSAAAAAASDAPGTSRAESFNSLSRSRAGYRRTLLTVPGSSSSKGTTGRVQPPAAALGADAAGVPGAVIYESSEVTKEEGWVFFPPNIVLDKADKAVGRLQLDLQAVVDSAEEWPSVVGFLLRRRPLPPTNPLAADPRALLTQVVRSAMQERLGLVVLRDIFNRLLQAYIDAVARAAHPAVARSAASSSTGAQAAAAVAAVPQTGLGVPAVNIITPNELIRDLFQWVHDEEVVDAPYLQAAVSEYCAASLEAGLPVPPFLQLLAVDLLLQQEQHYQAVQLLYSHPGSGSPALAKHLLGKVGKDAAAAAGAGMRPGGVLDTANPSGAIALELSLDVMSRQAVPELRSGVAGAHTADAPTAAGTASSGSPSPSLSPGRGVLQKASTAALVQQLLDLGEVLPAVRIVRTAGGLQALGIPASKFLEVAAASGDTGTLAAVYRAMRPHVLDQWPDFEAARQALCVGVAAG